MLLKDDIETNSDHYTEFYSSDSAQPNKPELHITYTTKKAARLLTVVPNSTMLDQSLWMPTAKNNLLQCDLSSVFTRADSFDFTEIQNYLDDGGNSVFISQSHGNYENDAAGNQALTYITINETQLMNFYSTDYYFGDLNLSNMILVIYTGCYTGRGGPNGKNLPNKTVSRGAAASIGFKHLVDGAYTNNWLKAFSGLMKDGKTVYQACEQLKATYSGTGLDNYTLAGNQNTKLKN